MDDLISRSATGLAAALRAREVSSVEVVNACLRRIEAVNPALNAVVQLTADAARDQAREADAALARGDDLGPLHGVPVTIKDAFETAGIVSTGGSKGRAGFIPTHDATAVARLRDAGAIILGKTNLPDLSLAFESDNLIYGRTNNPYDVSRSPGGSSGGEAAIIAAGGSPLGLGSDAAGSIRLPAHFCGIAGIKPTTGRVPATGHVPSFMGMLEPLTAIGPLARYVEDLALTLPILAGADWRDPAVVSAPLGDPAAVDLASLRVAYHTENTIFSSTSETKQVVEAAAKVLADAGMEVRQDCPEAIAEAYAILVGIWTVDGGAAIEAMLDSAGTSEPHPIIQRMLERLRPYAASAEKMGRLLARWWQFRSRMLAFLEQYDVIICPVCAFPAQPHGATWDGELFGAFTYTMAYNLTGWPGAVVRGGASPEGLPIGVQVLARPWREDVALAVARHLEMEMGGWQPPPL